MPLYDEAFALIRANLEELKTGNKVSKFRRAVAVGTLTKVQLEALNQQRQLPLYPPMIEEVVFIGSHIYNSRIEEDGYTIDDVLDQIASAMDSISVVHAGPGMTAMQNLSPRADRYGNFVRDKLILECSGRYPRPELFSVMPKGDRIKPKKPLKE